MDCSQCLLKCKAQCCGPVPIPKKVYYAMPKARVPVSEQEFYDFVIGTDKDNYCVFLSEDYRCTIYNQRPEVCKKFGDESQIEMTCRFQAKDGRIRARGELREIGRQQDKHVTKLLTRLKNG